MAHDEYSHTYFERFREMNIMQAAVEYARVCVRVFLPCSNLFVTCSLVKCKIFSVQVFLQ